MASRATRNGSQADLKQQLYTQELCDATLVAGGKRFPCNRALLASASPYFRAMFSSGFKESRDGEVFLKDMDPGILQHLLSFLYSGELSFHPESAEDIFIAASRLQLMPALELLSRYLAEGISLESCLRRYILARDHNNQTLLCGATDYLGVHFNTLVQHRDFPRLDLEAFLSLVSSDHLVVASELDVFWAMSSWVRAVPASRRLSALGTLLRHLRFPLLTPEETVRLQADLATLDPQVELQWAELNGAGRLHLSGGLREGMCQEKIVCVTVPTLRDILSASRGMDDYMECLDPATSSRTKFPPLALVVLPGCSVLEHRLYISGGKHPDGSYSCMLHEYSSLADRWLQLPPMSTPRSLHMFLTCQQKLFALSGWNATGPLTSAESFDVAQQAWAPIASLPVPLRFSASASYKDKLYLIGGDADSKEMAYRGILIYDPCLDTWAQVPLEFQLHGASAVPLATGIGVLGGAFSRTATHLDPNRLITPLLPCTPQCFFLRESGVISKEFTIPPLPLPLAFAGATVCQGRVYLVGGICTSRKHDAIYHWGPGEATWTQHPEGLTGQGATVRRVMKCVTLKVAKPKLEALLRDPSISWVAVGVAGPKVPTAEGGESRPPGPSDLVS